MKDLELLVRYQDGELNEAEKKLLIERLKNDTALNNQLDLIKDVDLLLGDKQLASFEETLREVEAAHFAAGTGNKNHSRRFWLQIAAISIVIISVGAYLITTYKFPDSGERLYSAYYQKLPADFVTRSESSEGDNFINAIKLYNQNKYQQAITEFSLVIKSDPGNNAARLFLGICYIETNNLEKATEQFKYVISKKDAIFEEHALWYLSLCYIKTDNPEKARPLLNKLVETRSYYIGKAAELLKKLK